MSVHARQLRDNPMLKALLDETEQGFLGAWEATDAQDTAVRERIFFSYRTIKEFRVFLRNRIEEALKDE